MKQDEQYQAAQDLRRERMRACLRAHPCGFQTYSDEIVRMAVEKVTVVDAGTIRVRFRGCEVEIEGDRTRALREWQSGGDGDDLHAPFYDCLCGLTNVASQYAEFGDGSF